ncbi:MULTISPECIES: precorrin-6A synthase (deacetylating) [unclassified Nocardioides]|uniref:precorrin-6A synthase (deacetylating) n=1 Tax=unclassified Nocardioides TaxID=2615069 RepID=UPI0030142390
MTRTLRVVGFGMGPQHVTPEAAAALAASSYVVAFRKSDEDPLVDVRAAVCRAYGDLPFVVVRDPERDRDPADYAGAVRDWHAARVAALRDVVASRAGDPAILVWGDPSLYDSTLRLTAALDLPVEVVPGIGAPSLLAARHGIVLHEVGRPVHVTTARRLADDVAAGQRNCVVMLTSGVDHLDGLDDWSIWWGANLGAPGERLVAGRVGTVRSSLVAARDAARAVDGWVMDVCLLRGPAA